MVVIAMPIDEELDRELQQYEEKYSDFKVEVSDIRKTGKDTFFVDTKMLDFPSLVKMARVTYDKSDVVKVKHLLQDLRHEVDIITNGSPMEHAMRLIAEANQKLYHNMKREARATYAALSDVYKALEKEERNLIVEACNAIRVKLVS